MKAIALWIAITASLSTAGAAERNTNPWDRETVGVTPAGSSTPNTARTDTNDYGARYSDGSPALGCRRHTRNITTPDGHSGETATFSCQW